MKTAQRNGDLLWTTSGGRLLLPNHRCTGGPERRNLGLQLLSMSSGIGPKTWIRRNKHLLWAMTSVANQIHQRHERGIASAPAPKAWTPVLESLAQICSRGLGKKIKYNVWESRGG